MLFGSHKALLFHFKVVVEGTLRDGDDERPAWELLIVGRGCWRGSMLGSGRQLLSRGFYLPAYHTSEVASAQRSPGATLIKETNNWINGGGEGGTVSGCINTLTPCGRKASQKHWAGARRCRRWAGGAAPPGSSRRSWRGAWILTAVKTPSDTLWHTLWLSHTHSHTAPSWLWVLRHIPPLSQWCYRPTALF